MEKVAPDIAYRRLKYVSDWRLVEENQRAALAAIVHGIRPVNPFRVCLGSSDDGMERPSLARLRRRMVADFTDCPRSRDQ